MFTLAGFRLGVSGRIAGRFGFPLIRRLPGFSCPPGLVLFPGMRWFGSGAFIRFQDRAHSLSWNEALGGLGLYST